MSVSTFQRTQARLTRGATKKCHVSNGHTHPTHPAAMYSGRAPASPFVHDDRRETGRGGGGESYRAPVPPLARACLSPSVVRAQSAIIM